MATVEQDLPAVDQPNEKPPRSPRGEPSFASAARVVLRPLASLKLTVVLFALSIFIVLAGTLAQVNADIWAVINEYFRIDFARMRMSHFPWFNLGEFFVWIDSQIFIPPAFAGGGKPPDLPSWLGIWFPKGWTIGAVMMLNLFAAHAVRFKMQAAGQRLILGWATIAFGCLITALVVMSGSDSNGLQYASWFNYDWLWRAMQLSLLGLMGLSTVYAFNTAENQRNVRWLLALTAGLLGAAEVATLMLGEIDDSSMRILYQVIKATLAACVLLVGCILVFRKRAGIVLLHGGIGLMMVFDVLVGTVHVESRMLIEEGQTVNFSEDTRTTELAIVDRSGSDEDVHTVIPARLLTPDKTISDERLPFDVRVVEFYPNSDLQSLTKVTEDDPDFKNPATDGVGKRFAAVNVRQSTGTDMQAMVDHSSAYVELLDKQNGESLGTYVVSVWMQPPYFYGANQTVDVDGKSYDLALRFKRLYKPYEVTLMDVQKNDYKGTNSARDYRSILKIVDTSRDSSFEYPVWMNNPLRYAGETFYQSNFHPAGSLPSPESKEATGLQVVSNTGWMIPYVSCMIVVVGMLAQFVLTLLRFLQRRLTAFDEMRRLESARSEPGKTSAGLSSSRQWIVPAVAAGLTALLIAAFVVPRSAKEGEMDIAAFGELPVIHQGRPQPFDALARNTLIAISDKQTFKYDDADRKERSKSAVEWLLEVIAKPEAAAKHPVFRIESIEMVNLLGLKPRPGSFRYALDEFQEKWDEMRPQVEAAFEAQKAKQPLTHIQRNQLELQGKVSLYDKLQTGFRDLSKMMPALPSPEDLELNREEATQKLLQLRSFLTLAREQIPQFGFPLAVPMHLDRDEKSFAEMEEADWVSYPLGSIYAKMDKSTDREVPPAFVKLNSILDSYAKDDVAGFNNAVDGYQELLASVTPEKLAAPDSATVVSLPKVGFEAYFNRVGPFNLASWIYVVAFVLVAVSWLGWTRPLNRAAFWMIATTFILHTLAIVGRIYISGRPPVTNLYSSAVFIGWATVLFGLGLEAVYRLGVGNVIAAVSGFLTLRIAHGLAMDGDTFGVLEAVLDTQFWLATHVVCVTLGYAATYVAALLGALFILPIPKGRLSYDPLFQEGSLAKTAALRMTGLNRQIKEDPQQVLARMTYGVLCFALFFSFVGTVLGGLWADDSWGRFWGWDPKENGALIIVLWNALVLHARWDGMIKSRGLAVMTVLGGIVVSWSWFGVNELSIGLHAYGETEGRLGKLGLTCLALLVIAGIGCLPRKLWRSDSTASPA